ncbi:GspE/PulE family protein [Algiphilus sp. W345]|uniref:GspE/PulE family protein n=1 Tax=Banduia mediterranea TaxID=3075609 RepID=A0ABU2WHQ0_9GAMM|nr:GspE/PulE family protein [Algiphilus sp. W345]MDT0496801.1 GspE/PulE family protein [Algiphilus sp. W345]
MNAIVSRKREPRLQLREVLDWLIEDGLLRNEDAREFAAPSQRTGEPPPHPISLIAQQGWPDARAPLQRMLTAESLTQWLAGRTGLGYQRIDPLVIDVTQVTAVVPYAYAARLRILPIKVTAQQVSIATSEPFVDEWAEELGRIAGKRIERVLANPEEIQRYLIEFYALSRSVKASAVERGRMTPSGVQNLEQLTELGRAGKLDANDQHVVNIVDWLLNYAFEQRASDIHIEPRRELGNVRFRIDGQLHEVYQVPGAVMVAVISRLKILARLDVAEKRKPQDGRMKTRSPDGREIELRASVLPTAFGEKLVLRIFDPEVLVKDYSALGLTAEDRARWESMIRQPHGIILVTGPTGSGKTTTLYSTLKQLATPAVNVCTIEDPIELVEPAFNQMQVQANIDLNFADGVRALLRQDPDIIMVGEIRDLETAEVAIQAALTGHLVLSTLHTNDAPSAITRLLDLGVPSYLIRATLLGVVAQRLLRRLCPHCRHAVEVSETRWRELTRDASSTPPNSIYESVGCLECRETGYLGRVGAYEILNNTATLAPLIDAGTDLALLRAQALSEGMSPLRISGARKIAAGLTSVDEVLRTTPDPPAAT